MHVSRVAKEQRDKMKQHKEKENSVKRKWELAGECKAWMELEIQQYYSHGLGHHCVIGKKGSCKHKVSSYMPGDSESRALWLVLWVSKVWCMLGALFRSTICHLVLDYWGCGHISLACTSCVTGSECVRVEGERRVERSMNVWFTSGC